MVGPMEPLQSLQQPKKPTPPLGYQQVGLLALVFMSVGLAWGAYWGYSAPVLLGWGWVLVGVWGFVCGVVLAVSQRPWPLRVAVAGVLAVLAFVYGVGHSQWLCKNTVAAWGNLPNAQIDAIVEGVQPLEPSQRDTGVKGLPRRSPIPVRLTLSLLAVNGLQVSGNVRVWRWYPPSESVAWLPVGSRIQLRGTLALPTRPLFEGDFDERTVLAAEGVQAVLRQVQHVKVVAWAPANARYAVLRWVQERQQHIEDSFSRWVPKQAALVMAGMVLGNRVAPLESGVKAQFAHTGLIHVLAASGFNVGIVAGVAWWLLQWVRGGWRLLHRPAVTLVVLLYVLLAGAAPSVLRAATMVWVGLWLPVLARRWGIATTAWSPLMLLGVGVWLLLLWRPMLAYSLSFQLSVAATVGILTMVPPLHRWLSDRITPWISACVVVPLVAQLWVTPLLVMVFHQFTPYAVVLNWLALVCVTPLTVGSFVAALLAWVWSPLGSFVAWVMSPLAHGLLALVGWGSSLPGALIALTAWPSGWVLMVYALGFWGALL
ncbi:MAG: ComEC/Rec2 family competence protein [Vampirovibrionales bacterium]